MPGLGRGCRGLLVWAVVTIVPDFTYRRCEYADDAVGLARAFLPRIQVALLPFRALVPGDRALRPDRRQGPRKNGTSSLRRKVLSCPPGNGAEEAL
jgi:hypothetical protein